MFRNTIPSGVSRQILNAKTITRPQIRTLQQSTAIKRKFVIHSKRQVFSTSLQQTTKKTTTRFQSSSATASDTTTTIFNESTKNPLSKL